MLSLGLSDLVDSLVLSHIYSIICSILPVVWLLLGGSFLVVVLTMYWRNAFVLLFQIIIALPVLSLDVFCFTRLDVHSGFIALIPLLIVIICSI